MPAPDSDLQVPAAPGDRLERRTFTPLRRIRAGNRIMSVPEARWSPATDRAREAAARLAAARADTRRKWLAGEDMWDVIELLKAYAGDHLGCTAEEAIAALGLPDMTGVPKDPKERSGTQRLMARQSREVRHYAMFVIRVRDDPLSSRKAAAGAVPEYDMAAALKKLVAWMEGSE
jgi:hypothetical protein